ncbi:MAG: tRNA dihydrouridine(20/20a) synthase DusA [Trueperaceae bacterium]
MGGDQLSPGEACERRRQRMNEAQRYSPRLSVAPMMDRTDRHFRFLMRQITAKTLLYTEMVNMNALIHGDCERHLGLSAEEHPVALQLGGDDPLKLAKCAALGQEWGYAEVNLNVGCPSDRVQNGNFGACLMAQPELVRDCLMAMRGAVTIPVTVKHRIGIDDLDGYTHLARFVEIVAQSGARRFTVHARKAWLKGLSPRENREIPPLRYDDVYRLKHDFPALAIELNGGVRTVEQARQQLTKVDAVMVGRAAYEDPFLLAAADSEIFAESAVGPSRREVVERMLTYIEHQLATGTALNRTTRHMLGLFSGKPGAKAWRRHLSEHVHLPGADERVVVDALFKVPAEVLDERWPTAMAGALAPSDSGSPAAV